MVLGKPISPGLGSPVHIRRQSPKTHPSPYESCLAATAKRTKRQQRNGLFLSFSHLTMLEPNTASVARFWPESQEPFNRFRQICFREQTKAKVQKATKS